MMPRRSTATPAAAALMALPLALRPTATSTRSKSSGAGASGPSKVARNPPECASSFDHASLEQDPRVALFDALLQGAHQIAVGTRHQPLAQLHHGHGRAEGIVDAGHLQPMMPPPTTSSRLQSSGSSSAPVESMMRGSSGKPGRRTDSDPAAMMHCLKSTRFGAVRRLQLQRMRADEFRLAAHHVDLALLREQREAVGQFGHDAILPGPQPLAGRFAVARTRCRRPPCRRHPRSPWPHAAAPSRGCSPRSGTRRPAPASAR